MSFNNHNTSKFWKEVKEYNKNKFLSKFLFGLLTQLLSLKFQNHSRLVFTRLLRKKRFNKQMATKLLLRRLIMRRRKRIKAIYLQRLLEQQKSILTEDQNNKNKLLFCDQQTISGFPLKQEHYIEQPYVHDLNIRPTRMYYNC